MINILPRNTNRPKITSQLQGSSTFVEPNINEYQQPPNINQQTDYAQQYNQYNQQVAENGAGMAQAVAAAPKSFLKENATIIIVFAVIVIALIILIVWLVYYRNKKPDSDNEKENNQKDIKDTKDAKTGGAADKEATREELLRIAAMNPNKSAKKSSKNDQIEEEAVPARGNLRVGEKRDNKAPKTANDTQTKSKNVESKNVESKNVESNDEDAEVDEDDAEDKNLKNVMDELDELSNMSNEIVTDYIPGESMKIWPIYQINSDDNTVVKKYGDRNEIKSNGFDFSNVVKCCDGKISKYKTYVWKYAQNHSTEKTATKKKD